MAWVPAIPQATDFISASQPLILGNFQALNTWTQVDHSLPDAGVASNGYHKRVTFTPQLADPDFPDGYTGLFSILDAVSGLNGVSIRYPTGVVKPFIGGINRDGLIGGNDGVFWLPNGALAKYNYIAGAGAGGGTITFTTNANQPAFTNPPYVFVQPGFSIISSVAINMTATTALDFTYVSSAISNPNIWFLAIGRG